MVGSSQQVLQVDVVANIAKVQVSKVVHLVVEALCELVVRVHLGISLGQVAHWLHVAAVLDGCLVLEVGCMVGALCFLLRIWPIDHLNPWLRA